MKRCYALALLLVMAVFFAAAASLAQAPAQAPPSQSSQQAFDQLRAHLDNWMNLYRVGKFKEALEELKRASELDPNSPDVYSRMASTYERLGDQEKVLETARRILELPNLPATFQARANFMAGQALVTLADHNQDQAKYQEAEQCFRNALQLQPTNYVARFRLGEVLLKENREAEGLAELTDFLRTAPATPSLNQFALQAQHYIESHGGKVSPEDAFNGQLRKAMALAQSRKYNDAIAEFKEAAKIRPDRTEAVSRRGAARSQRPDRTTLH
jgi:tetratricopeptide (TPR) repeat protein